MHFNKFSDPLAPLSPISSLSLSSPHRVLVVGAAYAGIAAVVNLIDLAQGKPRQCYYKVPDYTGVKTEHGLEITVIDQRDGYFHSVGAPLAHVIREFTPKMWKQFSKVNELRQPNLRFKHGSVKKVDPNTKTAEWLDRSGKTQTEKYDYLVMATGLKRYWPAVPKSGSYVEYTKDTQELIEDITGKGEVQEGRRVVVIGAGAVGIEFSGEIKANYPSLSVTLVHSRSTVLSSEPLPDEVKERVKIMLEEEGVDVILNNRATVLDLPNGQKSVTLADGTVLTADVVLNTTRKGTPTTDCLPVEALNDEKEVLITPQLSFKGDISNAGSHFAVGDVAAWTGIKRAGGAMVMGQLAAFNLYATIMNAESESNQYELGDLKVYEPVIGIAVGKQCLTYDKESGPKWGVELMQSYFEGDLGWSHSLKWLQLTDVEEGSEGKKIESEGKESRAEVADVA